MKANRRDPLRAMRAWTLPREERAAARAELRAEAEMRKERDNPESAERRAAAIEAEAWRDRSGYAGGPGI
jgi:hypothetical protein